MAFTRTPSISKQQKPQSISEDSGKQFSNSKSPFSSSSKRKSLIVVFVLVLFPLFFLTIALSSRSKPVAIVNRREIRSNIQFDGVEKEFRGRRKIKVGLINVNDEQMEDTLRLLNLSEKSRRSVPATETVSIHFDHVDEDATDWDALFPEWIDEEEKWNPPKCPEIPMPEPELYRDLDVIVARIPCGNMTAAKQGIRDVFRLQVNLAAATVAVASGWVEEDVHRTVYVVFVGSCGPMPEIFRCDDLVVHDDDQTVEEFWVYKPEMGRLKQQVLMPLGSCQLAPVYAQTGREVWRNYMSHSTEQTENSTQQHIHKPREAYVTILHSSEAYVCGAIALAQSIIQSNSTKDLILLADDSISPRSIRGLRAAGWKIRWVDRIRSPFAEKDSYNEWNYSKLRIWQLVEYHKLIFIDSDLLVLNNIDQFFALPQLSAATNNKMRFNSGLMVIEPSACMFEDLMRKSFELESYNGGDQGFLNEVFTWWHKLPSKINHLKIFEKKNGEISDDTLAVHYLGLKPWMCYRDYDCNWDMVARHDFASDSAHARWWKVYDAMPAELQQFCGLTREMDARITKWRRIARNVSLPDGHWRIEVKDPRQHHFVEK